MHLGSSEAPPANPQISLKRSAAKNHLKERNLLGRRRQMAICLDFSPALAAE